MNLLCTPFYLLNVLLMQAGFSYSLSPRHSFKTVDNNCAEYEDYYTSEVNQRCLATENIPFRMGMSDIVDEKRRKIPWYLSVPVLPVLFATSSTLPQGECKRQVQKYLDELNSGTLWAVRMFDSSTKYPEGIISGHTRHYGNFDECYQIGTASDENSPKLVAEKIAGKYCLVEIEYQKLNVSNDHVRPYTLDFDPNESAWKAIKEKGDFRRIKRYLLELALCVPDACTESNIEQALAEPLRGIGLQEKMIINTRVVGKCQAQKDSPEFSPWIKIYCYIILGLFLMVGVSTWYDWSSWNVKEKENKSLATDILLCFSVKRNFTSITEIVYNHQGLDCLDLLRVIIMCFALFGHRVLQYFANSTMNAELIEYGYSVPSLILLLNGTIIVEIFFTIGGIVRVYNMLRELDEGRRLNFFSSVFSRYIRFTPSYFIIIIFIAVILPHLGTGPSWESKVGLDSSSCAHNWWLNILYINNYVNTDKLCMFQSWYIAVDFHLYILSSFVIYCFWKLPRYIGYLFLTAIIIGGSSIPFCLSYFHNVQPMYILYPYVHELKEDLYFTAHYIKTHERLSSYFVGVLGGAIIYDHKLSPWNMPKLWKHFPFIPSAVILGIKSITMGFKFYNPNEIPTPMEKAFYAAFGRLSMAVAVAAGVIYMSVSDRSGFYHKLFKPRWAQPLAKLTYGVYLIHGILQSYDIGVARNARTYSTHNVIRDLVVDVVSSFSLAFILKLVVEEPFRKIEKRLNTKPLHKHKLIT